MSGTGGSRTYVGKVTLGGKRKNLLIRKKKSTNQQQNKRIKKLENIVYPSIEWKTKDIVAAQVNVSNAGYANYPMFQLAQGDTNSTREGDNVSLRHMTLNLSLTRGDTSNIVRVLVVATPSATPLTVTNVLQYPNWSTSYEAVLSSPYRTQASNNEQTYQVLFDKVYNLAGDISTIVDRIKMKMPKKGKKCEFVGTSSVSPNNYNISLLAISDSTGSPHPRIGYTFRSKYIDL